MTSYSLDEFQDSIDKFVLSVFQSTINHEEYVRLSNDPSQNFNLKVSFYQEQCAKIIQSYNESNEILNNVTGVGKTKEEQEQELTVLSKEYRETKERVLLLEKTLEELQTKIDDIILDKLTEIKENNIL